jgi:uncharacterized protein
MFNQMFQGSYSEKISKYTAWAIFLLAAFLLVQVLSGLKKFGYIGKDVYPQRTIMVSGEGEAFAVPDIASFTFSVIEVGATVEQAQEKADTKINKSLAAIKNAGVEERDIKTISYNVYPKYEWEQVVCITYPCPSGKNVLKGYEVSQSIMVKVRDTEKAGDLVTRVGAVGVSNISGLEFSIDDREKYVRLAREAAIMKAKENAKQLAKDLDVRLGRMLYFNENSGYPGPYFATEGMGGDLRASVAPAKAELPTGENKITSQVSLTYEIK